MLLGLLLLFMLISLAMKWEKPVLASGIYSVVKTVVLIVLLFVFQQTEQPVSELVAAIILSLVISFFVAWLMTWLIVKYKGKTWATITAIPLALVLIVF